MGIGARWLACLHANRAPEAVEEVVLPRLSPRDNQCLHRSTISPAQRGPKVELSTFWGCRWRRSTTGR